MPRHGDETSGLTVTHTRGEKGELGWKHTSESRYLRSQGSASTAESTLCDGSEIKVCRDFPLSFAETAGEARIKMVWRIVLREEGVSKRADTEQWLSCF